MSRALILLSTYNGSAYFEPFLQSIIRLKACSKAEVFLHIRDDGSHEAFRDALRRATANLDWITLSYGENVGAKFSFFRLIEECESFCDFYFFADQDDVWLEGKIDAAIAALGGAGPQIYAGRCEVVDELLEHKSYSVSPRYLGKHNALLENILTGCTIVLNRDFMMLLKKVRMPTQMVMHDAWLYLVGAFLGRIVFDSNSYIKYRQHSSNLVGSGNGLRSRCLKFVKKLARADRASDGGFYAQALQFREIFHDHLSPEDHRIIDSYIRASRGGFFSLPGLLKNQFSSNFGFWVGAMLRLKIILGLNR